MEANNNMLKVGDKGRFYGEWLDDDTPHPLYGCGALGWEDGDQLEIIMFRKGKMIVWNYAEDVENACFVPRDMFLSEEDYKEKKMDSEVEYFIKNHNDKLEEVVKFAFSKGYTL